MVTYYLHAQMMVLSVSMKHFNLRGLEYLKYRKLVDLSMLQRTLNTCLQQQQLLAFKYMMYQLEEDLHLLKFLVSTQSWLHLVMATNKLCVFMIMIRDLILEPTTLMIAFRMTLQKNFAKYNLVQTTYLLKQFGAQRMNQ